MAELVAVTHTEADGALLYEKCQHCHFFVDDNPAWEPGSVSIARWMHLSRGDEADDAVTEGHDAMPSGLIASLSVWREYGPEPMRRRFTGVVTFAIGYSPDLTTPLKVRAAIEPALQGLYGFVSLLHVSQEGF